MKNLTFFSKLLIFSVFLLVVGCPSYKVYDALNVEYVTARVTNIDDQMRFHPEGTDYRYIVATDKGTFVCEKSYLQWHFNASDTFYQLKKDSTYNFKLQGVGKGIVTDYKNILLATPVYNKDGKR